MLANPDKFQAITLNRNSGASIQSFQIGDVTIVPSSEVKMLGFTLDDKLTFKSHIKTVCSKAARQVNALQRISSYLNTDTKLAIYECFIKANFNYGPYIYHFTGTSEARMLEKVHERALRVVFNDFYTPYVQLLDKHNKLSLYEQRVNNVIQMVFKILHGDAPPLQADFFTYINAPYNLREPMLYQHMFNTQSYGFNSLRVGGASLWNKLPLNIKCCDNICNLKKCLKSRGQTCQCGTCFKCTM